MKDLHRVQLLSYEDYNSYFLAYLNSFELLKESITPDKFTGNQVSFPILFTMGHVVELGLKMNIVHISKFCGENYEPNISSSLNSLCEELNSAVEAMFVNGKTISGGYDITDQDKLMLNDAFSTLNLAITELETTRKISLEPFQEEIHNKFDNLNLEKFIKVFEPAVLELKLMKDKISKFTQVIDHVESTYKKMMDDEYKNHY